MKKLLLTIALFIFAGLLVAIYAQTAPTYALIIGVSKYRDANIKHLKYADDDALAFKRMLMSRSGGNVKSENIKCFINDSATSSNVLSSFRWVENAPKSGERMIIYFSGHGDAIDPEQVYLLTYDADASDPNLYDNSAINMYKLKNLVKKLKMKGVDVVLITDACRSNELTGTTTSSIYSYESIINKDYGEIKLNSCSQNQKSMEDIRWGNGHGVFTYYLLQGWMGMANENDDNEVTAGELFRFVTKKVKDATYDNATKKTLQMPSSCCSQHEDFVVSTIDAETLKRLQDVEEQTVVTDDVFAYATKSGSDDYDEDTTVMRIYNQLVGSVADNKILEPEQDCALYYYKELKKVADGKPILYDGESELLSALNSKGQEVLSNYLNGSYADINSSVFKEAFEFMNTGLAIIPIDDSYYSTFKSKALFLESQYLMTKVFSRNLALAKIDSAITLQPNGAYLFYSKGLIYEKFLNYDSAVVNYNKAMNLAPKWSAPYVQKSGIMINTGRKSDGINVMKDMIKKSNRAYNYQVLGDFYLQIDSLHLAVKNYTEAVEKDTSLIDSYIGLFTCYRKLMNDSVAMHYYNKAYNINPNYKQIAAMDANYDAAVGEYGSAQTKYWDLYQADTTNLYYYVKASEMQYYKGDERSAMNNFEKILSLDPYYTYTYYVLIDLEDGKGNYESSLNYNRYLLHIDPGYNPARLYMAFSNMEMKDSASYYLNMAYKKFPNDKFTTEYRAWDLMETGKYNDAIFLYESMIKKESVNFSIYTNVAYCYRQLNNKDKCLKYSMLAVKYNKYDVTSYKYLVSNLWAFKCSKDTIARFVTEPIEKYDIQNEAYLEYAAYQLTYLDQNDKLSNVCKLGIKLYPANYKFYLYTAIYYRKTQKKDFYEYFKNAVDLGLRCDDILEYKDVLPDPKEDKKYQKISKKICTE